VKYEVYSVYDSTVGAFGTPLFVRSRGEAVRSLQEATNDPKTMFSKYPSDYVLFCLGSWSDDGGVFDHHPPERVVSCLELQIKAVN